MPTLDIYQLNDTSFSGPDPWTVGSNANASSVGNTTFTYNLLAAPVTVDITDNDAYFDDADNTQVLTNPATINGTNYSAGQVMENEYSYIVRPSWSTNPADNFVIYVIDEGGNTASIGFISTQPLLNGMSYDIVGIESNNPSVAYVCFGPETRIETPTGPRRIEDLKPGDEVLTLDNGPQTLLWIGKRDVALDGGRDAQTPILFPRDTLAPGFPNRDLILSPQHRVMVSSDKNDDVTGGDKVFAPARALAKRPGVRRMNGRKSITYYSLMTERHEVLFANGVPAESFYPTTYSLSLLSGFEQLKVRSLIPRLTDDTAASYGPLARRDLTALQGRRLKRKRPLYEGARFDTWAVRETVSA